jgi:hypothetical protein
MSTETTEGVDEKFLSYFRITEKKDLKVYSQENKTEIKRTNLKNGFVLENFFSEEECSHYIDQSLEIGYKPLSGEYPSRYRNCERACVLSEDLSSVMWKKIVKFLTKEDIDGIKPMDFNNDGIWKPFKVNEGMKFTKYLKGQYFKPHIDGLITLKENESTIHTVIVYLNDDFEGGDTHFLKVPEEGFVKFLENSKDENYEILETYRPKKGACLIFPNYHCHSGSTLTNGTKYILRTEIVFKRMNHDQLDLKEHLDENFTKMWNYYDDVVEGLKSKTPDLEKITHDYLTAITYQYQHFMDFKPIKQDIPSEIIEIICSYLPLGSFVRLKSLNKHWNLSITSANFWKNDFSKIFYSLVPFYIEKAGENENLVDWYQAFKRQYLLQTRKPIIIEFSDNIKLMTEWSDSNPSVREITSNFVASLSFLSHGYRNLSWKVDVNQEEIQKFKNFSGRGRKHFSGSLFSKGRPDKILSKNSYSTLHEIFEKYNIKNFGCMILLKPPLNFWSDLELEAIEKSFSNLNFPGNSLIWVDISLMILLNYDLLSGIVVYLRNEVNSISFFFEGELILEESVLNADQLQLQIEKMLENVDKEKWEKLKANIILNSPIPVVLKLDNVLISQTPIIDAIQGASKFAGSDLFHWKYNPKSSYFTSKSYNSNSSLFKDISPFDSNEDSNLIFWSHFDE